MFAPNTVIKPATRLVSLNYAQLEQLEQRRLMAAGTTVALPYRLDFDHAVADSVVDKDGEGTGLTRVQANTAGNQYQPGLIDLDTNARVLRITAAGTATAASNSGSDNSQQNLLETQFDGTTSGFTVSARLIGPLTYLNAAYEQAGISFGPDQDNYIKLVALRHTDGEQLQFKDELGGLSSLPDSSTRFGIGAFANVQTLDLRLVGDAATGRVSAFYSVNGAAFQKVGIEYTLNASQRAAFFTADARAGLTVSKKNALAPITATFDSFEITAGTNVSMVHPSVTITRPGNGATGVDRAASIAADVNLPNSGAGVDSSTLTSNNVKVYRQSDGVLIPGVLNTTGGGDAIVFTPSTRFDANTTYVFQVTSGVTDAVGSSFLPFQSTFTTGATGGEVDTSVNFSKTPQANTTGKRYTSLVIGPDHRLYATTIDGKILRFDISSDGTLGVPTEILTIQNREGGRRTAIGLVFDPASTASNLIAYVSHGDFAGLELAEYHDENLGTAANFSGKITKLTGANLQNGQDIVTGLPRSVRDHQTYSLAFGPDGKLYVSQASMSAMGAPDYAWGRKAETLMSAAILQIDTAAIAAGTVNVQTEGVPNPYNPYAAGAPVKIYATGTRSAYDLLFHSNGSLYTGVNGSAAGGNTPGGGGVPGLNNVDTQDDYFLRIEQGGYYGHPNPLRGEYVLNGGNPTSGVDPNEVTKYPVGTKPPTNYVAPVYDFGKNFSPNGLIEYKGNAFNGALDHKILIVRYSAGDDILALTANPDGSIAGVTAGYGGLTGFVNPLDLIEDPTNGNIYVAEFGDQAAIAGADARITLLRPATSTTPPDPGGTPTGTANVSLSRSKVYLSDLSNSSDTSAPQTVRITNSGTGALTISAATFSGANAGEFALTNPLTGTMTLQPGQRYDFYVVYKATNSGQIRNAALNITTSLSTSPQVVTLRGLGLPGVGGSYEPSLQRIIDLYQIPINVGQSDPSNNAFPVDTAYSADEVTMPRLSKANAGPITVELLGVFANQNSNTTFGWYEAGNSQTKYAVASVAPSGGQSIARCRMASSSSIPAAARLASTATSRSAA